MDSHFLLQRILPTQRSNPGLLQCGRFFRTNIDSILKSRDITSPTKFAIIKALIFPSGRVLMWELDHKEGWALKNWYFWIVMLEIFKSPLDCKEIKPVNPKVILNIHWQDWWWSWSSNTLATWCEKPAHWKRPWCWERLKAKGEGRGRGWDG